MTGSDGYSDEVSRSRARRRIAQRRGLRAFQILLDESSVGRGLKRLKEDPEAEFADLERELWRRRRS